MARIKHQQEVINSQLKVPQWYPSAPRYPGKYEIRARDGSADFLVIFAAPFAAKKFIEAILNGDSPRWKSDREIELSAGDIEIRIESKLLEEIMEYEYTEAEDQWELPQPYSNYARQLRGGRYIEQSREKPAKKAPGGPKNAPEPVKRSKTPAKASGASRSNLVSAIAIAAELKLKPQKLRAILRELQLPKPAVGWAWPSEEAEKIKRQIAKKK